MADTVAFLKLRIVKGTNLAVRDVWTSDPFVVTSFGNQEVKTNVIKKNLNPVWNEELFLYVRHSSPLVLKLEVFDKDKTSGNDKMGDGEVNLSDLASAAKMLKANASKALAMKKNKDGSSCIKCVDGQMVEQVCLKLQNVESGELELHIKWVDVKY